ncbi:MAG: DUF2628 domain-containing protein [Rhodospirillales bacterium]|nr:DUF2628 domain-containing protein [Rhodospirillales bacterium]MSP79844.1 DUF2628 domain-containing protein [Rhodospirillales bacterium]
MRFYTAYVRHGGLDPDRDVALVKEGFSWPAFFLGVPWALFRRLWFAALVLALATAGIATLAYLAGLDPTTQTALTLGLSAAFGWLGNDLRRRKLERAGFVFRGAVAGDSFDAALKRFLDGAPDLARELARTVRP